MTDSGNMEYAKGKRLNRDIDRSRETLGASEDDMAFNSRGNSKERLTHEYDFT